MHRFLRASLFAGLLPQVFVLRGESRDSWIQATTNGCIALAHFAIVVILLLARAKRKEKQFRNVILLFVVFNFVRGVTQALGIWTLLHPAYELHWLFRMATMVLAVATALALAGSIPALRRVPSMAELEREIVERTGAEQAARDARVRLAEVVENVRDYSVYALDPEGLVRTWDVGAERMSGFPAGQVVGRSFSCFFSGEDAERGRPEEALRKARENGRSESQGWRYRADGSRFWAQTILTARRDGSGELVGFTEIVHDLSESRETEARFQALLEAAPDAILIVDGEDRIEFLNSQSESLFGYARRELLGLSLDTLIPARVREAQREIRRRLFAARGRVEITEREELLALRKDGTEFPFEFSLSPLETREGWVFLIAVRDLTERRAASLLLAEANAELRQSNDALEQFAHIASHDLQEPLRMVASYTQLLAKRYKGRLDADADEFISFAVDGTQRMKRLIEDLLLYSRSGRGSPPESRFSCEQAMREALRNLEAAIQESHAVVTCDPLPELVGVESQLVQIFQNLVGNAIKYRGQAAPRVHVSARKSDAEWIFSFADNGIGIAPQHFERIFLIFQRLHGRGEYEGTGVGLAICKRILQQQGGRIWVESEPGRGSTFHFALPVK